jgi:hypothetical protein
MIPSTAPSKRRYKFALALLALLSIALFTACQTILGDKPGKTRTPTLWPTDSATVTATTTLTPTLGPTFTHLPGDLYFLYQTQTAAPTKYPTIGWETSTPTTPTPMYTLTAVALALTKSKCVLAYPDFCVSATLRLNCLKLGRHDFKVLPPDPYGYDVDGNGIGCETGK